MTAWLLTLAIYSGYGNAVTTQIVPDKVSCQRAGEQFKKAGLGAYSRDRTYYTCTEITK